MIKLKSKVDCCGCTACMAVCPVTCITMWEDVEGFQYPVTNESLCINCNACNKVCPIINKKQSFTPFENSDFYAAQIKDEEMLKKSSSGGIFSLIASNWLTAGGVVYGVRWDGDVIKHDKIETVEELKILRGSKYAQSNLGDTFREIKGLLTSGRKILFSGTPCQVDGLKRYLCRPFDSLLTIEVACHGVPSPLVLKKYLSELKSMYNTDILLEFRDKSKGWKNYNVKALTPQGKVLFCEHHKDNIFMRGFLHELFSRPSCQACPSKGGASGADFTLCDFWGIEDVLPEFGYEDGVSLMIANTSVGKEMLWAVGFQVIRQKVDPESTLRHNGSLLHSCETHPDRIYFFKKLHGSGTVTRLIATCLQLRLPVKLQLRAKAYIRRLQRIISPNIYYTK